MRRLSKRWETLKQVRYRPALYRAFLPEIGTNEVNLCWGCIEAPSLDGPFRLEIWNHTEQEWEFVQEFPTFKEAKEVGRLLAGVALNKNI
jgi:hypothetical protein